MGSACHGCDDFNCLPTGKRTKPWRFYCDRLHREVMPVRGSCTVERASAPSARKQETFGEWLERRMSEEGLTMPALSKRILAETGVGLSRQAIKRYMQGASKPRLTTRRRVYVVLGRWPHEPDTF